MTKKDCKMLAKIIRESRLRVFNKLYEETGDLEASRAKVDDIFNVLENDIVFWGWRDNPRLDETKFLNACREES